MGLAGRCDGDGNSSEGDSRREQVQKVCNTLIFITILLRTLRSGENGNREYEVGFGLERSAGRWMGLLEDG